MDDWMAMSPLARAELLARYRAKITTLEWEDYLQRLRLDAAKGR